jgi:hypothetical protein
MAQVPFDEIPKEHQEYLNRLIEKLQVVETARKEIFDFMKANQPAGFDGRLWYHPDFLEVVYSWDEFQAADPITPEDIWYASDQDC